MLVVQSVQMSACDYGVETRPLQNHVTEYGTHWNFFLTFGLVTILAAMMQPVQWFGKDPAEQWCWTGFAIAFGESLPGSDNVPRTLPYETAVCVQATNCGFDLADSSITFSIPLGRMVTLFPKTGRAFMVLLVSGICCGH